MKKLLAVVLALTLAALGISGCGKESGSDLAYIQKKGKLVVGITEYAPMDYKDENGQWTGFDAEFARAVGEKLGVEVEFLVLPDWGQKFNELSTKNIDAIWNGLTLTEEVKANTSYTDAYVTNAQVVVIPKDRAVTDTEALKKLNFAAENGSAGAAALKELGIDDYVALKNQASAVMEVAAGTSDACVIDITMAKDMTGEGTNYEDLAICTALTEEQYVVAFRKNSDLTAKVNEIIAELKQDGTLGRLAETYQLTLAGK